jgi:hypothetical protein
MDDSINPQSKPSILHLEVFNNSEEAKEILV